MITSLVNNLKFIVNHPINRTQKCKAVFEFVKWQIGSRLVPGEVIYHWIEGTKFIVSPGEHGLTQNIYCGFMEFKEMVYVLHVLREEDTFIDIGANVGSYTILACGARKAKGYCFEPVPETFIRLKENLKLNNLLDQVQAYNIGLADKVGELFFTTNKNTNNHIIANNQASPSAIKIKVTSLDVILKDVMPTMIKIDVEGFESLVIEGAIKTLNKPSLHTVIMEINGNSKQHGFREQELLDTMRFYGFHTYTYDPFNRNFSRLKEQYAEKGNTIFCRDETFIQERIASAPKFHVKGLEF